MTPPLTVPKTTAIRPPKVYLAGKIRKNCWRYSLVSGLRAHHWDQGDLPQATFTYVGPHFVSCDHGCAHQPTQHGAENSCVLDDSVPRQEVVQLCFTALQNSDLVFCYIDSRDCYGTLVEIGYAIAMKKVVVVALSEKLDRLTRNEHWFGCTGATKAYYAVREKDLPSLLSTCLEELQ
jgi:Nucleoside 2-deoxyribosyltransferase like